MSPIRTLIPMGLADFEPTIEFLARRPIEHAQLLALARRAQATLGLRRKFRLGYSNDGQLNTVIFQSPQTIVSHSDPGITANFPLLPHRSLRMLTGPPAQVSAYLARHQRTEQRSPRLDAHQQLYLLTSLALEPAFFSREVSEADVDDLDLVTHGTAHMIQEELGYDPSQRPTFRQEILQQILARRWWIAKADQLHLLCRVGATTQQTMQLECIWAPPAARGVGHATRALATICAQLLQRRPTLSLAVNDHNTRARKLYERLGFVPHSTQRTILW